MFSESEFEYILNDYKLLQNEKMKSHKKASILFTLLLILIVVILYVLGLVSKEPANILIPLYSGILFFLLLIYISYSFGRGGSKAFYELIIPKVIDKINFQMEADLVYSSNKKTDFLYNKIGGLFSPRCRSNIRMSIKGTSPGGRNFELYELILVTGGGKNQQINLNGIYIVFNSKTSICQQIRSNGKPQLKGTKYERIESDYKYRVYLQEGSFERDLDVDYKDMFSRVMEDTHNERGYLSIIENQTHFALHPVRLYKYRKMSLENINIVYDKIKWLIEIVDKLSIEEF